MLEEDFFEILIFTIALKSKSKIRNSFAESINLLQQVDGKRYSVLKYLIKVFST